MKVDGSDLIFPSGHRETFHAGIVGMTASGPFGIYEGYDGPVHDDTGAVLKPVDLIDLADHMIARWQKFRAEVVEGGHAE